MILMPPLPAPNDEVLKLEDFLDRLEPLFKPSNPTEDNPLDLDHFAMLDAIETDQSLDSVNVKSLVRHHLNGLRQFCCSMRESHAVCENSAKLCMTIDSLQKEISALKETASKD